MEYIVGAKRPKVDLETGNVIESTWTTWSCINQDGVKVTDEYASIESLSDHLLISPDSKDYDNIHYIVGRYDKCHMYYGIMALKRDEKGLIIPNSDTLVVPYLYSKFKFGGLKTIIASIMVKGYPHYTYVDLDPKRRTYGKQLVPMLLTEASAFKECNNEFEGFAHCIYKGNVGYIPRNIRPVYEDVETHMIDHLMMKQLIAPNADIDKVSKAAVILQDLREQYGKFEDILKADQMLKERPKQYTKNNN